MLSDFGVKKSLVTWTWELRCFGRKLDIWTPKLINVSFTQIKSLIGLGSMQTFSHCSESKIFNCFKGKRLNGLGIMTQTLIFFPCWWQDKKKEDEILAIRIGDDWVEGVFEIRQETMSYFTNIFHTIFPIGLL